MISRHASIIYEKIIPSDRIPLRICFNILQDFLYGRFSIMLNKLGAALLWRALFIMLHLSMPHNMVHTCQYIITLVTWTMVRKSVS